MVGRDQGADRFGELASGRKEAENWAITASLIETCKLNAVDPLAYLTATLTAIVNGHKQSQIEELFPWNYPVSIRQP